MTDAPARSGLRSRVRAELRYFLEILALTGFVVAQPVLDVFGRSPETFLFQGADRGDIVGFALVVGLAPPLVLAGGAAVTNVMGASARRWAQAGVLSVLFGMLAVQVVKKLTDLHDTPLVLLAVATGAAFGGVYLQKTGLRLWIRYASVAPAVFVALFLATSPVAELMRAGEIKPAHAFEPKTEAPLVMLVLDELPLASIMKSDGTIDAELFPHFAELAGASTWYRNATTVALRTFYALPAILTGRYPSGEEIPISDSYPQNLFTWLAGTYDIEADEAITRLCPPNICSRGADRSAATPRLLDEARSVWSEVSSPAESASDPTETLVEEPAGAPARGDTHFSRGARLAARANMPARFEAFLEAIEPTGDPSLHLLHLLLPHGPWRFYPSGVTYDYDVPGFRGGGDTWTTDADLVAVARQRHLLQLQYVDALVGRLIDRLREQGLWDDATLVVTADHGIAFQPGQGSRGADADEVQPAWPELVWVPLFIRAPALEAGAVSDRNVQTIDIVPTIADLIGADVPWKVDGISAVGTRPRPGATKEFLHSWARDGTEKPGTRRAVDARAGNAYLREHTIDRFRGTGDPEWAVHRSGPHPELVGRRVQELTVSPQPAGTVHLARPERFHDVDSSRGILPGEVWGTVDGVDDSSGPVVVLAINGTIAATTRIAPRTEGVQLAALPPERLWHDGRNDVAVFLLRETAGGVELSPLSLT
jgi:Sulfatase